MDELLKSSANMLSLIKRVGSFLTSGYPFQRVLHCLTEELHHKLESRYVAVLLFEPEAEYLKIQNACGLSQGFMNGYQRLIETGVVGKMVRAGENIIANEVCSDSADYADLKLEFDFKSVLAARITYQSKAVGFVICQRDSDQRYLNEDLLFLEVFSTIISVAFAQDKLLEENRELAVVDKETGVYKFGFFCERTLEEIVRSKEAGEPLSILLIDIDNYKRFLRSYGTDDGLELLKKLVGIIKKHIGDQYILGRYGRDQLIVTLLNKDESQGVEVAEKIRSEMHDLDFKRPNNSVSIGVYCYSCEDDIAMDKVLDNLGITIFHAHYHDGNQVCSWSKCLYGFPE